MSSMVWRCLGLWFVCLSAHAALWQGPLTLAGKSRIVSELKETGVAILLVEQNARAALQVSNYGYVLETGEVKLAGRSAELAADPRVIEAYLGLGHKH